MACAVANCSNNRRSCVGTAITFHKPSRQDEDAWSSALGMPPDFWAQGVKNKYICSKHFSAEDIYTLNAKTMLKPGAVPCLFVHVIAIDSTAIQITQATSLTNTTQQEYEDTSCIHQDNPQKAAFSTARGCGSQEKLRKMINSFHSYSKNILVFNPQKAEESRKKLQRKVKNLEAKLSRSRKTVFTLKKQVEDLTKEVKELRKY